LRADYRERYDDAPPSVRELAEAVFLEPIFTVSRAAELIDMSYPAANKAVDRLEADGLLRERTGQQRYREFQAMDVLDVLNRDIEETPAPGELIAE
jgi:DNA-binding Lrp family transcriptional regulator